MSAQITEAAITAAAIARAGGRSEWEDLSEDAKAISLEDARVMLQAAIPYIDYDRRPVGEFLANVDGGGVRWLNGAPAHSEKLYTSPPHVLPSHCIELRQLLIQCIEAEKKTWTGDNRIAAWTALDAMLQGFDQMSAKHPVIVPDAASILRHAAAVLDMWESNPDETGYMGDFGDAIGILELLAKHDDRPSPEDGLQN